MVGTGKLGSAEALHAGIERGDVVVKKNQHGRELYHMDRTVKADETHDSTGGSAQSKGDCI